MYRMFISAQVNLPKYSFKQGLTFHSDLCHCFYDAQAAHGYTGVVGWLTNTAQFQNISAHRHLILWCQVLWVQHPLDVRHGRTHCNTRYVHTATRHNFLTCWWNGEARRHPSDWEEAWGRGEDDKEGEGLKKRERKVTSEADENRPVSRKCLTQNVPHVNINTK